MKKDNPYYLGNDEMLPTRFIFEINDKTLTRDVPWDASVDDVCSTFYTFLSSEYGSQPVLELMYKYGSKELKQDNIYRCESFIVPPCRLTVCNSYSTMSIDLDIQSTGYDLCKAFHTLLVNMTWHYDSVYDMMKEYAEEMLPEQKEEENILIDHNFAE